MEEKQTQSKQDKKKKTAVPIWRLFQFASRLDLLLIFIASLSSCAAGAIQPASILFFGDILKKLGDAIIEGKDIVGHTLPIIRFYVYMGTGVMVSAYISNCFWVLTGENQARRIKQSYVHSILGQDMSWFDKAEEGSLTTRLASDIQLIQDGISEKFGQSLLCFSQFVAGCSVAFTKGWRLAAVMMAVTPALACTGGVMGVLVNKCTTETQDAYADAGSIAEQVFTGIRTVYSFSLQKRFSVLYEHKLNKAMKAGIKRGMILGIGLGTFMFCLFAIYGLSFWYGSKLVHDHIVDGSTVLVVFLSMMMGEASLLQVPMNLAVVSAASAAAYKIFETIHRVPEINSNSNEGLKPDSVRGELEFKNVQFKYPTRPDTIILKDLSLKVRAGSTVAFVGPSGSGKSTSVQLIQRFYDPTSGQVTLDGTNLKQLNVKWIRQQIGVVSQEPVLFNTTIRQNLMMGSHDPNITFDEIVEACKKANCHTFIKQLPKGYDTLVGEHGGMLSGGQKQRIAIARAILKNPAILLLDEATSALDTQSERLVQKALEQASENRTTIVVAHRLSTVRNADLIVVMDQGNLVEQGTHTELISKGGVYANLVKKQEIQTTNNNRLTKQEQEEYDETLIRNEAIEVNRKSCIELERASQPAVINRKSKMSIIDVIEEKVIGEKLADDEKEPPALKNPMMTVFRAMRPQWAWIFLGCCGAAMAGAVFPLYALFFSKVIVMLNENDDKSYGPLEGPNKYAFLFVVLGIVAFMGFALQIVSFEVAGSHYTKRLRSMLFEAYMKQEIGYYDLDENNVGALSSKLAVDARNVNEVITRCWGEIIQILFTSVLGLTISLMHTWKLTLIILTIAPLIIGATGWNSKIIEGFESTTKKANEQSFEVATEAIKQIRTVTAFNKQAYFENEYFTATQHPHKLARRKAFTSSVAFALLQGSSYFMNAIGFYAGAHFINQGKLELSDMVIAMISIMIMAEGVGRSSVFVTLFAKAKVAANRTYEVINRQPTIDPDLEGIEPSGDDIDGSIDFNEVAFRYPARPNISIFDGEFNLKGKSGQTIALVGPSGCGKSTTIGMLQRWYDPLRGTVRLDNHNVNSFSLHNLRSHMALVGQEPVLFDLSIEDNIRFGMDDSKTVTDQDIQEACKAANIHKFITGLPDGYNTRVGDKGSQLSGGQKQRIAIARALIRKPKVLLLDEATSALDSESEKLVQAAIDNIIEEGGRTTITIAHRLSTITNADLICVIKDGRVIEQGSHWDLLKLNGVYKDLVQQQSLEN